MKRYLTIPLLLALAGCAGESPMPSLPPAPTALTLDEWKTLEIQEKYDEATFERLRMQDPKLKNDRHWRAYFKQHILPERDKDIPGRPGAAPSTTS